MLVKTGANDMTRQYSACLKKVNGSSPPPPFLDELVDWALGAPDVIFMPNAKSDIYSSVRTQLGPYSDTFHRKAVMLEVLRVLAGHESTWNWNKGVDPDKNVKNTPQNEEAGALQCSWDSMGNDKSLKDFVQTTFGKTDEQTFITNSKTNHKFAIEYAARLLRVTVGHHGPIKHHHIHGNLHKAAASEFMYYLKNKYTRWLPGDFPLPPRDTRYA
jgi:hypothetical protein